MYADSGACARHRPTSTTQASSDVMAWSDPFPSHASCSGSPHEDDLRRRVGMTTFSSGGPRTPDSRRTRDLAARSRRPARPAWRAAGTPADSARCRSPEWLALDRSFIQQHIRSLKAARGSQAQRGTPGTLVPIAPAHEPSGRPPASGFNAFSIGRHLASASRAVGASIALRATKKALMKRLKQRLALSNETIRVLSDKLNGVVGGAIRDPDQTNFCTDPQYPATLLLCRCHCPPGQTGTGCAM
jgi:hypothetical protein